MNNENPTSTLYFLITAEFSHERGYSYGELITYLKNFQTYYRDCYTKKEAFEKELNFKNKTFTFSGNRILELENIIAEKDITIKEKEKENEFLISVLCKKLTFWERITGKVKI